VLRKSALITSIEKVLILSGTCWENPLNMWPFYLSKSPFRENPLAIFVLIFDRPPSCRRIPIKHIINSKFNSILHWKCVKDFGRLARRRSKRCHQCRLRRSASNVLQTHPDSACVRTRLPLDVASCREGVLQNHLCCNYKLLSRMV